MKQTATAPANIAFIKYWGKSDDALRLPLNPSLSMNLTGSFTTTTVEFSEHYAADEATLVDGSFSLGEVTRITRFLDRIRRLANSPLYAKVMTRNSFPKGAGAAASASGFAALTVAACSAIGLSLSEKELSALARLGSGSACRSIPPGFVLWESEFAYSVFGKSHWALCDALCIVDAGMKKVSTTSGMEDVRTSPLLRRRISAVPTRLARCLDAISHKDFRSLGEVMEEDCLDMHAVMRSQDPGLNYWNRDTIRIMDSVRQWRTEGLSVYFTIDAGPNVHIIYEKVNEPGILPRLGTLHGIATVIHNDVAGGTEIAPSHLF